MEWVCPCKNLLRGAATPLGGIAHAILPRSADCRTNLAIIPRGSACLSHHRRPGTRSPFLARYFVMQQVSRFHLAAGCDPRMRCHHEFAGLDVSLDRRHPPGALCFNLQGMPAAWQDRAL